MGPYTGIDSYAYWGIESGGYKQGDPSVDQNIPFNKMKTLPPPKGQYTQSVERTFDSLIPNCIFTEALTPGTGSLEMALRDPFLMLAAFSHKAVSGSWGTGTGVIDADFSDFDDEDTIWIQYRNADKAGSNHIDRLLTGGKITQYKLMVEPAKLLKEVVAIKMASFSDNTQAMSCSNDFHNQAWGSGVGGWSNWDDSGLLDCGKSARELVIKWNAVDITGLKIQTMEMVIDLPDESIQEFSDLEQTEHWRGAIDFTLTISGKVNDKTLLEEAEKTYENKAKQTLILYIDDTVGEEKYIQVTNVYVDSHDVVAIAPAGESSEASVVFKGGEDMAISYKGNFVDLPDPSALITT